jgi:hypothetical protein
LAASLAAGSSSAQQPPARAVRPAIVGAFLQQLQDAVNGRDRTAVTRLARYPVTVLASGLQIPVSNPSELVRLYDIVFTPELRCAIVESRLASPSGSRPSVAVMADGVSLASGSIWATVEHDRLKITRVIVPPSTSAPRGVHQARRIAFVEVRGRPATAQFSGVLARDDVDTYVMSATAGQWLDVKIEGFPGRSAGLRVAPRVNGQALTSSLGAGDRTWTGTLPETTEYRIDVVRRARFCDPALLYTMSVTIRQRQ